MKFILLNIFSLLFLFNINIVHSDDKIDKLKKLLDKGLISEKEFKKAASLSDNKKITNDRIKIRKDPSASENDKFLKYEFYIDNYRVHTLNPGVIRIDNILTGESDVTLSSNFKSEFTKNGNEYFELKLDKDNLSAQLFYKGKMLINWTGKYVKRHNATFYQMQVLGYIPFHFYIKISGKKIISLNMDKFNKKIEKKVNKVKEELALKYNISVSEINRIMENKQKSVDKEIEKVISEEQEKLIKEMTEKYAGQEITDAIRDEIERTVGEEVANALISAIEQASGQAIDAAIEAEVARYVDEAIAYAIQQGVSEAAAAAAIEAMLWVYAMGGTDEQAMEACRYYAGDAC